VAGGPASAADSECAADADCEGGTCEDGSCQIEVRDRVEVPPELGDRYVLETRRYWPLLIGGGALFGAAWIGTIVIAGATADDGETGAAVGHAFVPVVGPMIMHSNGTAPEGTGGLLIVTGALQGLGLLTAFVGLTVESSMLVPTDEASPSDTGLVVSPYGGPGKAGLVVTGRF
jgi:hypothetical protein